jgi:hypothetical protein
LVDGTHQRRFNVRTEPSSHPGQASLRGEGRTKARFFEEKGYLQGISLFFL